MMEPGRDTRLMADLTWQEFAQRVADDYIFILTVGAVEQHGPHLPIGYDYMMGHEIALQLALRFPVVVLPPLAYGYRSQATVGGGDQFPGTTCVGGEALIATVRDILEELVRHGARRIVVQNSHIENQTFLAEAIELCRRKHNLEQLRCKILLTGWGYFTEDATLDSLFEDGKFPGWDPEHAAVVETSTLLALRPEFVAADRLPDELAPRYPRYSVFPTPPDVVTRNGALAPAAGASAAKGERILADVMAGYADAFAREFGIGAQLGGAKQPRAVSPPDKNILSEGKDMAPLALDKRRMEHLTWQEFARRVEDNYVFILVAGAIEEHGPHLPLGFDYMMGYEIALELANRYPAIVMSPLTYGYRSQAVIGGGDRFPGTTCVGAEALMFTVRDILEDMLRHGVKRLVILNSHLENQNFLVEGIELARRSYDLAARGAKVLLTGWAPFVKDSTLDELFDGNFPGWDPEHAALLETSAMLGIRPEVVDMTQLPDEAAPRYPKYSVFPTPPDVVTVNGALAPATKASIEKGQQILNDVFEGYEDAFQREFGLRPCRETFAVEAR